MSQLGQLLGLVMNFRSIWYRLQIKRLVLGIVCFSAIFRASPSFAEIVTINFSADISQIVNVPNAGSVISGTIQYDPSLLSYTSLSVHDGVYSGPTGSLTFTTDGGYSISSLLSRIEVSDDSSFNWNYTFVATVGSQNGPGAYSTILMRLFDNTKTDTDLPTTLDLSHSFVEETWAETRLDGIQSTYVYGYDLTSVTLTTSVPEPSTWAMMIFGFAGLGFLAYRRKISFA
jgi:PEP-CTERM motif